MKNFNDQAYQINKSQHPQADQKKAVLKYIKWLFLSLLISIGAIMFIGVLTSSLEHSHIIVYFFGFPLEFNIEETGGGAFFLYWMFMMEIIMGTIGIVINLLFKIAEMKIEALNESYRSNLWAKYQAELLYSNNCEVTTEVKKELFDKSTPQKKQETISLNVPEGVKSFQFCQFEDYVNLQSIVIPKSISFIATSAFKNCKELKNVYYRGSEDEWKAITIYGNNEPLLNANIHYNHNEQ